MLERFQNINFIPPRVVAELATNGKLHVEVDIFGITEAHLTSIAARIGEATSVVSSYWHGCNNVDAVAAYAHSGDCRDSRGVNADELEP